MAGFQVLHGEHQNIWDKDGCSSAYFFRYLIYISIYLHGSLKFHLKTNIGYPLVN